jgi:hypothetical protein
MTPLGEPPALSIDDGTRGLSPVATVGPSHHAASNTHPDRLAPCSDAR